MTTRKVFYDIDDEEFVAPLIDEMTPFDPPAVRPRMYFRDGLPDTFGIRNMLGDYRQAYRLLKRIRRWYEGKTDQPFDEIYPDLREFFEGKDLDRLDD